MGKVPKTLLTFDLEDKCYSICSFKENKKGELLILPRFAENYSEKEFGNLTNDKEIIDQHYTIHHNREGNEEGNVLNHTLCLRKEEKKNTRIYTRAFNNNLFCPIITIRGQNYATERYECTRNEIDKYIDIGTYLPNESTIYFMIIGSSAGNKLNGDYNDLNYINLNFENFSIIILWCFGIIPSHSTGNKFHKLTQPEFKSQLEEGFEESEIINLFRLDRQLQHSSFLSFLQKEYHFNDIDFVLFNSLGFRKLPDKNISQLDKDKIDINLGYYSLSIGNEEYRNGKHDKALTNFSESKKVFNKHKNQVALASVLDSEARLYHTIGKSQMSINVYNQELSIYKQISSSYNIANTHLNISMVYRDLFQNAKAKENIQKAIEISDENNFYSLLAISYRELGILYKNEGNIKQAEENLYKALASFDKEKNEEGTAFCLGNLGLINLQKGDFKESLKLHSKSLEIFKNLEHQWGIANETANIGNVNCILGNNKGFEQLKLALKMHKENGFQFGIATDLKLIGVHHAFKINRFEGMAYLKKSRDLFFKIGNKQEANGVIVLIEKIKAANNI